MSKRRIVLGIVTAIAGLAALGIVAANPVHHAEVHTQSWSFNGFFGSFDQAQLKRGHVIYKDVCSGCHSMRLLAYRDLQDIGYTEDEVKAFAAEVQVEDGPNDAGEMFERPGRPSDRFKAPFPNEQAARAGNNGALPPDLSLMAKARAGAGFLGHDGADYIFSLMTMYKDRRRPTSRSRKACTTTKPSRAIRSPCRRRCRTARRRRWTSRRRTSPRS